MKKLSLERIGNFAEQALEIVAYGVFMVASYKLVEYAAESSSPLVGYDDAVRAITKSGMFSHDKRDAIEALKRHGDPNFYKAIVHIVEDSSMFSHDKLEMIQKLSEK